MERGGRERAWKWGGQRPWAPSDDFLLLFRSETKQIEYTVTIIQEQYPFLVAYLSKMFPLKKKKCFNFLIVHSKWLIKWNIIRQERLHSRPAGSVSVMWCLFWPTEGAACYSSLKSSSYSSCSTDNLFALLLQLELDQIEWPQEYQHCVIFIIFKVRHIIANINSLMHLIFTFMNKLYTNYNYISLLFIQVDRESMHKKLHIVCLTFFSILQHEPLNCISRHFFHSLIKWVH